jgi:hypothetical protein
MATMKKSLKYTAVATLLALTVIGATLYANTIWSPPLVSGQTNFLVMLTDPPNVPTGTTKLNVTYSNIQLHVVAGDGTANWVASQESGKVDLLSLVNVKQTIANLNLPVGSIVDKLQFKISSAKATINGIIYPVTILSDQLVISLKGTKLTSTTTGALIDLRPTLMKINASDSNGDIVSYYILVPSATAIIEPNVNENQMHIGAKSNLDNKENEELNKEYEKTKGKIVITEAAISVNGEETTLSVTLENTGDEIARIKGLEVQGDFRTEPETILEVDDEGDDDGDEIDAVQHGILFKISGKSLVPLMGDYDDDDLDHSGVEIQAGKTVTLNFNGVIKLSLDDDEAQITVTPIEGNVYSMRPLGDGLEIYKVTAQG